MSHKDLVFKHGDNYGIWKLRAMRHLVTKDLFGVDLEIDGWIRKNLLEIRAGKRRDNSCEYKNTLLIDTDCF
jgi:hypothetical protein